MTFNVIDESIIYPVSDVYSVSAGRQAIASTINAPWTGKRNKSDWCFFSWCSECILKCAIMILFRGASVNPVLFDLLVSVELLISIYIS